ncbi:MAG TPA: TIM44-like domain-containing protein [Trinickia sp.]|jgi:predicted lipid-binding transport protein (Tim44 family)|nr:TIM44-like domain-containing protein [Trinickia sp.]
MSDSFALPSKKLSGSLAKRIWLLAVVSFIAVGTVASLDAEAKRMGGGRSIGRQSQSQMVQKPSSPPAQPAQPTQQSAQPAQAQRAQPGQAPQSPPAAPARSRWLGPIAGLAAGLGIAALLSHFGLGEAFAGAMANIIVIAVLAMVGIWLIRKLMSRRRSGNAPAYGAAGVGAEPTAMNAGGFGMNDSRRTGDPHFASPSSASAEPRFGGDAPAAMALPAGFDADAFLRSAKVNFVRLQAAWDDGNLADIREFTTPEMFAEVKVDFDERGTERNQTEVVQLNADLLDFEDRGSEYVASVRFSGLIRESAGAAAQPFAEIWNLTKTKPGNEGWLLAGIQQEPAH